MNTRYTVVSASEWMLPLLVQADRQHFGKRAWDEQNWRGLLSLARDPQQKETVLVAVEVLGPRQVQILGFSAWAPEREKENTVRLLKVAVQKSCRRNRIGMKLVNLEWTQPFDLIADVSERHLLAQKFFRGCGWFGASHTKLTGKGTIRFSTVGNLKEVEPVGNQKPVVLEAEAETSEQGVKRMKRRKDRNRINE